MDRIFTKDDTPTVQKAIDFLWTYARRWPTDTRKTSKLLVQRVRSEAKALANVSNHCYSMDWTTLHWALMRHKIFEMGRANLLYVGDVWEHVN